MNALPVVAPWNCYATCCWHVTIWNPHINTEVRVIFAANCLGSNVIDQTHQPDPLIHFLFIHWLSLATLRQTTTHYIWMGICYATFPRKRLLACGLSSGRIPNSYLAWVQYKRNAWMVTVVMMCTQPELSLL